MTVYELIRALVQGIIDGKWSGEAGVTAPDGYGDPATRIDVSIRPDLDANRVGIWGAVDNEDVEDGWETNEDGTSNSKR